MENYLHWSKLYSDFTEENAHHVEIPHRAVAKHHAFIEYYVGKNKDIKTNKAHWGFKVSFN